MQYLVASCLLWNWPVCINITKVHLTSNLRHDSRNRFWNWRKFYVSTPMTHFQYRKRSLKDFPFVWTQVDDAVWTCVWRKEEGNDMYSTGYYLVMRGWLANMHTSVCIHSYTQSHVWLHCHSDELTIRMNVNSFSVLTQLYLNVPLTT